MKLKDDKSSPKGDILRLNNKGFCIYIGLSPLLLNPYRTGNYTTLVYLHRCYEHHVHS